MRIFWLLLVVAIVFVGLLLSGQERTGMQKHQSAATQTGTHAQQKVILPDQLTWSTTTPDRPAGMQRAILEGNPNDKGQYVIFTRNPAGMKFMPHSHPMAEWITVIDGEYHIGFGKTFDPSNGTTVPKMGFIMIPANVPHYAWTDQETILEVSGMGPSKLTYVNPADNPANNATSKAPKEEKQSK